MTDRFLESMGAFVDGRKLDGAAMITEEIRATIRRLVLREGWKIETAARRFGVHHSVVRRIIHDGDAVSNAQGPVASNLDPFKDFIVQRLTDHPRLTAVRLLFELQDKGYTGGIAVLRRYVAKVRAPRSRKAYVRIESEPGEQAQVDWGSFGHWRVGNTQRPLSAFAMILRWSRALYIDFSLDQRMDACLHMHQRALAFFGGVPQRIVYDNLKSVVLHHVGSTVQFKPTFLGFAGQYLFEPVAAQCVTPSTGGASRPVSSSFAILSSTVGPSRRSKTYVPKTAPIWQPGSGWVSQGELRR